MSEQPSPMHLALMPSASLEPSVIVTTETELQHSSLKQKTIHQSAPVLSNFLRRRSRTDAESANNITREKMTHRQRAEIQLESLLNEPEESLPVYLRSSSYHFISDQLSIEQASKLLATQPFIIERLAHVFYSTTENKDIKILNGKQIQVLTRILNSTMDVRALVFFMMVDEYGNDFVTSVGLTQFYEKYFKDLKTFDENRLQEVINVLLRKFHLDQKSEIDFEEFYSILLNDSTLLECLSQFTVNPTWFIKSPSIAIKKKSKFERFFSKYYWEQQIYEQQTSKLTVAYIKDNLSRIIVIILYIIINLTLLIYVIIYRAYMMKANTFVVIARIGGMMLNFNCALMIVLMLKQTILLIRANEVLRKFIPVDDHIDFHKMVGRFIAFLSVIHTAGHMANFATLHEYSWMTYMFTTIPNIGWIGGFAPLSGVFLCIILTVVVICSMHWIRHGGHFQLFHWTHLLYMPFNVLLILHATNFWKWVIGPLTVFIIEKLYVFLTVHLSGHGRTHLLAATIEQSNVVSLTIDRPKNFVFKPGDHININLPSIARYEYHPFAISSAPEDMNYLRIHIRAIGNWTRQVYNRFKNMSEQDARENRIEIYRADLHPELSTINFENRISTNDESILTKLDSKKRECVLIKGPYSSFARYMFDCKHVVLIAGGIGITPYASVLSSLIAQFRSSYMVCQHCKGINMTSQGIARKRHIKKIDFIWVNRNYRSFEWFLSFLRQFEQDQEYYMASNPNAKPFLNIHLYFTEIKNDQTIGKVPLDMLTGIWAQINEQDLFTNLKSKTHFGRPDWNELFNRFISGDNLSQAHEVGVFFCGPSTMGKTIRKSCTTFRFKFYEEKF